MSLGLSITHAPGRNGKKFMKVLYDFLKQPPRKVAPQPISAEERKADLEFFRTFLNDYEKAFNAGQIHHGFQADFR